MLLHHDRFFVCCDLFLLKSIKVTGCCRVPRTPEGKPKCPQTPSEESGIQFGMKWSAAIKPNQNTWTAYPRTPTCKWQWGLERKPRIWYASEIAVRVPHVLWVPDLDGRQPRIGKWVTGVARKSSLLFWLQVRLTRGQWGNPLFISFAVFTLPAPTPQGDQSSSSESGDIGAQEDPSCLQELFPKRVRDPATLSPCSPHLTPNGGRGAFTGRVQHSRIDRALAFCPEDGAGGAGCDTQCWEVLGRLQKKEELGQVDPCSCSQTPGFNPVLCGCGSLLKRTLKTQRTELRGGPSLRSQNGPLSGTHMEKI